MLNGCHCMFTFPFGWWWCVTANSVCQLGWSADSTTQVHRSGKSAQGRSCGLINAMWAVKTPRRIQDSCYCASTHTPCLVRCNNTHCFVYLCEICWFGGFIHQSTQENAQQFMGNAKWVEKCKQACGMMHVYVHCHLWLEACDNKQHFIRMCQICWFAGVTTQILGFTNKHTHTGIMT